MRDCLGDMSSEVWPSVLKELVVGRQIPYQMMLV